MDKRQAQPEKVQVHGTGTHKGTGGEREKQDLAKVLAGSQQPQREFLHGTECSCASSLSAMLKNLFLTLHCQRILIDKYHKSEGLVFERLQKRVGRSGKDSSGFTTWEADASCSHSQDREDDDPGMRALGWETDVCFYRPETQYLTYLAPKTQTCGTQHLVPVRQCGDRQALEAHQILQKHS